MIFNKFTELYDHYNQFQNISSLSKKATYPLKSPIASQPLIHFLSPQISPILDTSYKWNYIICCLITGFFHLACFHLYCSMYQLSILFYDQITFHLWIQNILFILSGCDRYLGWFHILFIINNATVLFHIQVFVQTCVFISLKHRIVELNGRPMFNIFEEQPCCCKQ